VLTAENTQKLIMACEIERNPFICLQEALVLVELVICKNMIFFIWQIKLFFCFKK